jgi:REP element-mobilizing transposase RayT
MSEKYKTTDKQAAYFVTFTIVDWVNVLQDDAYKMILINAIKFYQEKRSLIVYAYCIMKNHVHMIVQSNGLETVSEILRDLKKYSAKEIIKKLQSENTKVSEEYLMVFQKAAENLKRIKNYKVWQDGNRPMILYSNKFIWQKLSYIHNNAVETGDVLHAHEYMFSSARNYAELSSHLNVVLISNEVITVK